MWKRLTHSNILPLLGITTTPLQLISNRMLGGDLPEYIMEHPVADRFQLVCPSYSFYPTLTPVQLSDVTKGLYYLHSSSVIHGDLKGVRGYFNSRFATILTPV